MRTFLAALLLTVAAAGTAGAAKPANPGQSGKPSSVLTLGTTACGLGDIGPGASACGGWYEGNLNGGSPAMTAMSADALNALLGTTTYDAASLSFVESLGSISGSVINFATPLFGDTVFAVHVGAAAGQSNGIGYQSTAFYRFDAGNLDGGLDQIAFNVAGLSNARLYFTGSYVQPRLAPITEAAVPDAPAWAMMIFGFGAVGMVVRRRRQDRTAAA